MSLSILITGMNGFVGSFLYEHLSKREEFKIFGLVRKKIKHNDNIFTLKELQDNPSILKNNNIKYIINAAGKAHVRLEFLEKNKRNLYLDNVKFSRDLSILAKSANIKLMIHISTSKVYGENGVFNENSKINPEGDYSKSKVKCENEIINVLKNSKVNLSIIRPPMIYGKNFKGNFKVLLVAIKYKIPIITSKTEILRSFLSIENLLSFIEYNLFNHKKFEIFNVSDPQTLSINKLISIFSKLTKSTSINIQLSNSSLFYFKKIPILKKILNPLTSNFIIKTVNKNAISKVKLKSTKEMLKNYSFKN